MAKSKKAEELPPQPVLNIGMVGHVDHGKTTLLERLSGKWTDTHSEELKRGITIRLGYADVVFGKCGKCDELHAYTTKDKCPRCGSDVVPLRKVSFVDAPGHESLMATMLAGATIMDAALLLVAANERCPQPQTREHVMALEIVGIKEIIIVQNKIDLVSEEQAVENCSEIRNFLKDTPYKNAPIVPISAQHSAGISVLIKTMQEKFETPERDSTKSPVMLVARSFDINRPGIKPDKLVGGVLGGSLKQGILKQGDKITISPGRKLIEKNREVRKPITAYIVEIISGNEKIKEACPGGSIGVLTSLDPSVVKSDQLTGSVVSYEENAPQIWYEFTLQVNLLKRVVGTIKELNVEPIKLNEPLMLNVNSAATVGIVVELKKNKIVCRLKVPVCADAKSRVTLSRNIGNRFRLIGYGEIQNVR